jgi:hypothetical protein
MASELGSGVAVASRQVLLLGDKAYAYWEIYTGFGFGLPVPQYSGNLILCYWYEYGGDTILVELRKVKYEQQITGIITTAEEREFPRLAVVGEWITGGFEWWCTGTDLPYP